MSDGHQSSLRPEAPSKPSGLVGEDVTLDRLRRMTLQHGEVSPRMCGTPSIRGWRMREPKPSEIVAYRSYPYGSAGSYGIEDIAIRDMGADMPSGRFTLLVSYGGDVDYDEFNNLEDALEQMIRYLQSPP